MVVAGTVYVGSWDGFFYALDRRSGSLRWKFQVDCQHTVLPIPPHCLAPGQQPPSRVQTDGGIITSSATLLRGRVYFAAGKTLYALRAHDGGLLWKTVICGNPDRPRCETDANDPTRIFSSPVVIDRKVIIGHTVDEEVGYRGGIKALDMNSGRIEWSFEVDPKLDQNGRPLRHPDGSVIGQNRGCGNVWSSGAVDERQGLVFFGDC